MRSKKLETGNLKLETRKGFSTLLIIVAVAVVGVVAILAFGVFDVGKLKTQVLQPKVTEDQTLTQLEAVGTSDEVPDIEKDLLNTDLETIDAEISDVDRELQSD